MTFIIGFLVGAIITAAIFLIIKPKNSRNIPDFSKVNKDGEKFNPGDGNFDSSNFKPGEGKSRRSKDNSTSVNDNAIEDKKNEKQD